jgi:hypothetical protein
MQAGWTRSKHHHTENTPSVRGFHSAIAGCKYTKFPVFTRVGVDFGARNRVQQRMMQFLILQCWQKLAIGLVVR